ncbi:NAD-dependent succinate-semialdehyde dehydrogenase [Rhizobium sp. NZLR11]|uniref:NAD-dependent succinate-semialdehyde dehydrogenase n=1 Tax=Rhizobium sp. NZLR11 TaxID=2731098 RepID=UPI001C82D6AD|nr:NAD-dependent succinate-semialdehyde dehydrogenase [Rhizobium sp. NZLR11]MBX5212144.1 NAD-dependent succinate-semialdehyde dehydrogenase [Rhizobium sp. NZLR11]
MNTFVSPKAVSPTSLHQKLRDPSLFKEQACVGGRWVDADNGETIPVYDPATGSQIGTVPSTGAPEAIRAIEIANSAYRAWANQSALTRAQIMEKWFDLVIENSDDLATIITVEQGKPIGESRTEISYGAGFIKWFSEEARRTYGQVIPANETDRRILAVKQPVGVSAAITPWNFPVAMIARKCAPAIAAGCPVIVKPSEFTPFSAMALALLAQRAGLPDGILSVLTGPPEGIGSVLTGHPTVRKLSFTGSTRVGKILMRQCSETVKRVSFELGGNAPFLILDDADIDLAVSGVIASKFRNAGQTCVCANRILVQDGIYDRFADKLAQAVSEMKVGNGLEPGVAIGPLINLPAVEKVNRHIENALGEGAKALLGGVSSGTGQFCGPTILTGATASMLVAREETFGPVAPLFRFKEIDDAIDFANDTPFGLAAYAFSESMHRALYVGERLEFGMIGINSGSVSSEVAPFGGMKESGIGREGAGHGIDEYLELKTMHIGGMNRPV